jgi:catechol 2,3-dioxygenase-like lactoylglutathione lyase family enzyme
VAVDSVDKAAEWYGKHFGFRRIRNDRMTDRSVDGPDNPIFKIYGGKLNKVKVAWLSAGNSVGFELFEFIDPPTQKAEDIRKDWTLEQQYQRGGFFHICVTSPDPDALAKEACQDGAMQVGETITAYDGEKALYLRDPWGNVVEVLSCSFEQLMGNRE